MKEKPLLPVMKAKCATCPFRDGSPYADLRAQLLQSALTEATRICHSTSRSAINPRGTGKKAHVCRGTRDEQITLFHRLGILKEPTDAGWQAAWDEGREQRQQKRRARRGC